MCEDGFVYNFEVEGNNNYFADGVLVHNCTALSYRKILDYFKSNPDIKILGVTATPDRTDEEALGQVCDSVAFNYTITEAISDGWLRQRRTQCATPGRCGGASQAVCKQDGDGWRLPRRLEWALELGRWRWPDDRLDLDPWRAG
jgi:hypothetical protein